MPLAGPRHIGAALLPPDPSRSWPRAPLLDFRSLISLAEACLWISRTHTASSGDHGCCLPCGASFPGTCHWGHPCACGALLRMPSHLLCSPLSRGPGKSSDGKINSLKPSACLLAGGCVSGQGPGWGGVCTGPGGSAGGDLLSRVWSEAWAGRARPHSCCLLTRFWSASGSRRAWPRCMDTRHSLRATDLKEGPWHLLSFAGGNRGPQRVDARRP